ncbi:hypothetical protein [Lapidilactobacillus salsurivasis]
MLDQKLESSALNNKLHQKLRPNLSAAYFWVPRFHRKIANGPPVIDLAGEPFAICRLPLFAGDGIFAGSSGVGAAVGWNLAAPGN